MLCNALTFCGQELSNDLHPRFPTYVDVRTDLDWARYVREYEPPNKKALQALKRTHTLLFTEGDNTSPQPAASAFTHAFNTATHRSGAGVYHDPGAWPPTIL